MRKLINNILCFFGMHEYTNWEDIFIEEGNYLDADAESLKDIMFVIFVIKRFLQKGKNILFI